MSFYRIITVNRFVFVFDAGGQSAICSTNLSFRARLGAIDGEICKFAGGELTPTTAARNNPKRCYRTSISSGYSSHSSPLSAGSYSCYASASTRDPSWYGDLAVIHETETIPRPIWPSALYHHAENCNVDYEGQKVQLAWSTLPNFRGYRSFELMPDPFLLDRYLHVSRVRLHVWLFVVNDAAASVESVDARGAAAIIPNPEFCDRR